MNFNHKLTFAKAVIKEVKARQIKGTPRGIVELRAALTHDIAISIGVASSVYAKNGTPLANMPDKQNWDHVCNAFRAIHEVDQKSLDHQRQSFGFDGTQITDAKIEKSGKKGLVLSFKMHFAGADRIVDLISYWLHGGSGAGSCKLVPVDCAPESMSDQAEQQIPLPGTEAAKGKARKAQVN